VTRRQCVATRTATHQNPQVAFTAEYPLYPTLQLRSYDSMSHSALLFGRRRAARSASRRPQSMRTAIELGPPRPVLHSSSSRGPTSTGRVRTCEVSTIKGSRGQGCYFLLRTGLEGLLVVLSLSLEPLPPSSDTDPATSDSHLIATLTSVPTDEHLALRTH
jgi:hypothetical protein